MMKISYHQSQEEIRFVLPGAASSPVKTQFLFQGQLLRRKQQQQKQQQSVKASEKHRVEAVATKRGENNNQQSGTKAIATQIGDAKQTKHKRTLTDNTIDDILGTKKSKKAKRSEDIHKKKESIKLPQHTQQQQEKPPKLVSTEKTSTPSAKHTHKQQTEPIKPPQLAYTEKTSSSSESKNNVPYSLVRSVEDAVLDKAGRRPRSNSTDCELQLPQRGLCDESVILRSLTWDIQRLYSTHSNGNGGRSTPNPPRGFTNLGNTCFLNATLQCLTYLPTFCQAIAALPMSAYEQRQQQQQRKSHNGQHITLLLRQIIRMSHGIISHEKNEQPKTNPITPKTLHKKITSAKINGIHFRPGRQEDAHELLVHLLDAMHEGELMAAGINPNASGWRDRLPIPRLDETTFIHRIFGGYFRSQLKCNSCGYKSNTYDPFLDLALEVSKRHIDSLQAAFAEFAKMEKLDSDNRWKCSGCKKHVCPTKHLSVFRPPLSLCIHLKRFEFNQTARFSGKGKGWGWGFGHRLGGGGNGGSKISKKINFPAHLNLPLSDGRICPYLLTGVISHVGNSATSGHYTAFVRQPGGNKQWLSMDDSFVERVSESTVLRERNAYVLFYTRKEIGVGSMQRQGKKEKKRRSAPF